MAFYRKTFSLNVFVTQNLPHKSFTSISLTRTHQTRGNAQIWPIKLCTRDKIALHPLKGRIQRYSDGRCSSWMIHSVKWDTRGLLLVGPEYKTLHKIDMLIGGAVSGRPEQIDVTLTLRRSEREKLLVPYLLLLILCNAAINNIWLLLPHRLRGDASSKHQVSAKSRHTMAAGCRLIDVLL